MLSGLLGVEAGNRDVFRLVCDLAYHLHLLDEICELFGLLEVVLVAKPELALVFFCAVVLRDVAVVVFRDFA